MISAQSRRGRRIVGSLDRGDDLFEALRSICDEHQVRCGEFRGTGALERADLCAYDQEQRQWKPRRTLGGGLELLHLAGNLSESRGDLSIVARATLMRERDVGIEIVGGRLLGARVFSVELVIECFDDLVLRRFPDAATGLDLWQEALADGQPPRRVPDDAEPTLDDIDPARASAFVVRAPEPKRVTEPVLEQSPEPAPLSEPAPQPAPFAPEVRSQPDMPRSSEELGEEARLAAGDVIVHPRFRRCVVERVEGDNEFVQVRLRNGRVVRLSLEVIELTPQGTENGQRIYAASIS